MTFTRPANHRQLTFEEIAKSAKVTVNEVSSGLNWCFDAEVFKFWNILTGSTPSWIPKCESSPLFLCLVNTVRRNCSYLLISGSGRFLGICSNLFLQAGLSLILSRTLSNSNCADCFQQGEILPCHWCLIFLTVKNLLFIQLEFSLKQLLTLVSPLFTVRPCENSTSTFSVAAFYMLKGYDDVSPGLLSSRLRTSCLLSLS